MKKIQRDEYLNQSFFLNKSNALTVVNCGCEKCLPGHFYGPAIREDYYLIHFVIDGKGVFEYKGKTYNIEKNEAFIIFPNEVTLYTADMLNPWHYYWVGFGGSSANRLVSAFGLTQEQPVIRADNAEQIKSFFMQLYHKGKAADFNQFTLTGYLYLIFSCLKKKEYRLSGERYAERAVDYINNNFMYSITVEGIAEMLFIDRSYFYRIFKQSIGISPQEYITSYRLGISENLLKFSNYSITDIAVYTGFSGSSSFGKAFKEKYGCTPLQYRKRRNK